MKPLNERLKLIDEAIDKLGGEFPKEAGVVGDSRYYKGISTGNLMILDDGAPAGDRVYTRQEFEQRLKDWKELYDWGMATIPESSRPNLSDFIKDQIKSGEYQHLADAEGFIWEYHKMTEQRVKEREPMEEYEYMKEYECNGVKPDLPDDVKIEFLIKGQSSWFDTIVGELVWTNGLRGVDDIEKFRIVDKRWKSEYKNDWYEKGEIPANGTKVLGETDSHGWIEFIVTGHQIDKSPLGGLRVQINLLHKDGKTKNARLYQDIKPLRTEEDELLEKIENSLRNANTQVLDKYTYKALAKQLLKDGLVMKEDECTAHML